MATDYERQLEEENASLKNLLDERTKELDVVTARLNKFLVDEKCTTNDKESIAGTSHYNPTFANTSLTSYLSIDGQTISSTDIINWKHLWGLHMQKENNPSLLYRIWCKILLCLNMKKN